VIAEEPQRHLSRLRQSGAQERDELNWLMVGMQRGDDNHGFQARRFDCLLGTWVVFERGNAAAGMNIKADVNQ
jgi:hypothetical protein